MAKAMRIQKALSDCGFTSRRKAEELIKQGRIKINGHPAVIGAQVNPDRDVITVDGERVYTGGKKQNIYIALYKPRGYVTSMSDELGRKTVDELVSDLGTRVYPIGRLDRNSEGLLLMTNDGEFANQMMHPKYKVAKTYRVTVHNSVTDDQVTQMASGVVIDGRKTEPCEILVQEKTATRSVMQIVLREGRNRQIRKMCESVGLEVVRLKRMSVGAVKLGVLQPGEYRHLTSRELELLKSRLQSQENIGVGYKEPKNVKVGRNFGKDDYKPRKNTYKSPRKSYKDDYDDFEDYGVTKKKKSDKWYENIKKR